ncbi:MAG: aminoglycoside phosphotransferase family protein [Actinomycetota bacterium]
MIEIPEVLANKARSLGAEAWLVDLAGAVADIERDWGLSVGSPYADGTEGWVAPAIDRSGHRSVLKLCVPRPGDDPFALARREITVLARAGGRGCVALERHDGDRGALLLERLGPSLADIGQPFATRLEILAGLAVSFWTPVSAQDPILALGLQTGPQKAAWLIEFIETTWPELDRPCSEAAVADAIDAARRRAAADNPQRAVLVHGDIHPWNTLRVDPTQGAKGPASWRLIDPDGLVAEPEYDLGVLLREDPEELLADIEAGDPRRRARWLAERTGTDEVAIWDWGLCERVSTGLLAAQIGLQPIGDQMLAVADRLAEFDDRR